jgi:hypothetical protein
MLEGQVKIAFENWLVDNEELQDLKNADSHMHQWLSFKGFKNLHPSMQYGVYVDFFKSPKVMMLVEYSLYDHRIRIIDYNHHIEEQIHEFDMTYDFSDSEDLKADYEQAAITKASQIFNERKT